MSEDNEAYRSAILALLMHVRSRVLAGEDPIELRQRLLRDEELSPALVDQVWVSVRPQLVSEQENKGMRLRVLLHSISQIRRARALSWIGASINRMPVWVRLIFRISD